MRLDEYTDDVICTAMGVGNFEPLGVARAIRLLVKPAFHPEACVTLEPTQIHVTALRSMLWREPIPCRLPELVESSLVPQAQFDLVAEAFGRAAAEHASQGKRICLDGMAVSAVRVDGKQCVTFKGQPIGPEQAAFVVAVLRLAHGAVASIHLRNRIAECGRYIDRTFTVEPEAEFPHPTRIMMLGGIDDRRDYFDTLRQQTGARPPK